MKNTIIVNVTRGDLAHRYDSPCNCPIAKAIKRELPDSIVYVGAGMARINGIRYTFNADADEKAFSRAQSFIGWIKGGFKVVLTKQHI